MKKRRGHTPPNVFKDADDPHRNKSGRPAGAANLYTRNVKAALERAGDIAGDKMAIVASIELREVLAKANKIEKNELDNLSKIYPEGMASYFAWLAIKHPALYVALIGQTMPKILEGTDGGAIEIVYRSAEQMRDDLLQRGITVTELKALPMMDMSDVDEAEVVLPDARSTKT